MDKTTLILGFFVGAVVLGFMMNRGVEGFAQKEVGMPLNAPAMGPYDSSPGGWMSTELMPVGSLPQNEALEQNKLMYLVGNKTDASCCPSTFASDTGCLCLTNDDKELMAHRGGNK